MKQHRILHRSIILLACLSVSLSSCILATPPPPTPDVPATGPTAEPVGDWLEVYFTDPDAPNARDFEGGPDEALASAIDNARLSVDVAIYNLNLWSIRDALLNAQARGVVVRMVVESDNMDGEEIQQLKDAGIPVIGDRQEGLMHNKFVIIDRYEVWTGSMNFTLNGAYQDNNNLVHIRLREVAEDYLVEFNEMFEDDLFGPFVQPQTPNPLVMAGDTVVQVAFSPDDGVQARLLDVINNSQRSIYFLAYSFTADPLGEALISRAAAGLTVVGVMESDSVKNNTGTEYDRFLQNGMDVRLDANKGLMHHKVIIVDESIVITGSYNFTASADEKNDENVVIINNPEVASIFLEEFWKVYNQTSP